MFKKVLMVCIGNICRSPAAEGMLKAHVVKHNLNVTVASAGISAMVDYPAAENSQLVMKERGIDISAHRARQITQELILEHDLILVMEEEHKEYLERNYPFAKGKIQTLGRWQNQDIADPYKQPLDSFEHMATLINTLLNDWIERYFKAKK